MARWIPWRINRRDCRLSCNYLLQVVPTPTMKLALVTAGQANPLSRLERAHKNDSTAFLASSCLDAQYEPPGKCVDHPVSALRPGLQTPRSEMELNIPLRRSKNAVHLVAGAAFLPVVSIERGSWQTGSLQRLPAVARLAGGPSA